MASIEPRYNKAGQLMHYRLIVSGGLNWEGKQIKRTTTWKPPRPNMSKKQMEREAMAAAFKFEEAIQAGYTFCCFHCHRYLNNTELLLR